MRYINTILIALLFTTSVCTQNSDFQNKRQKRQDKMESKIESQKVAFISQKLDLSPEEAQRFWPIYNDYQNKMKAFRKENKIDWDVKGISDSEADGVVNDLLAREQEELNIKKDYMNRLKTAVPARKVAHLYVIEKEFRNEILAQIRNKIGKNKRRQQRRNDSF